jgi:putative endonuclease
MTKNSETGAFGEDVACKYLKGRGYKIIERNFRRKWGELDIIVKHKDGTLVFIEVKTMRQINGELGNEGGGKNIAVLSPEDNLTKSKLIKLQRTAALYAGEHEKLVLDKRGWRIDLIAILLTNNEKDGERYSLKHYENI